MAKPTTEPTELRILTLEEIEAADDTGVRTIQVPGWRGAVRIRPLLLHEVQKINKMARVNGTTDVARANALFMSKALVEPELTFTQAMKLVETKSGQSIARLINEIFDDQPTEEAIEEAEADFRG